MAEDDTVIGVSAAMLEGTAWKRSARFTRSGYLTWASRSNMPSAWLRDGVHRNETLWCPHLFHLLATAFDNWSRRVPPELPVTVIADRAGLSGRTARTHHGLPGPFLHALPAHRRGCGAHDENDLQHLVYTAYKHPRPFAIRIARERPLAVTWTKNSVNCHWEGQGIRKSSDVVIFGLGKAATAALGPSDLLVSYGIACGVVNPVFVKPLDVSLLVDSARASGRIVTVEENVLAGGFGSAVLEALSAAGLDDVAVHRIGMPDSFVEHGTAGDQRHELQLDAEGIAAQILETFFPDRTAVSAASD